MGKCDKDDIQQVFHAKRMLNGFQIRVAQTNNCLDTAGGGQLLVYPCYEESVGNYNQVWNIREGRLIWEPRSRARSGVCVNSVNPIESVDNQDTSHEKKFALQTCAPKRGQRLQRED